MGAPHKKHINVLHLIAPISFGGGESLLVTLLSDKRPELHESVALIYSAAPFEAALAEKNISYYNLRHQSIGYGIPKWQVALDTSVNLLTTFKLLKIVESENIDVIHVQGYPGCLLFYLLKKFRSIRGIYTHQFYRAPASQLEKAVLTPVYSAFDYCTGASKLVSDSMNQAFPETKTKFCTVYNCVSARFYTQASPDPDVARFPQDKQVFIQIARFIKFKNQMLVVESLTKLSPQERDNLFIVFAGDGPEKDSVMKFVQAHQLEHHVCFLGAVSHAKLPQVLAGADFGLFPSENEGFGIGAAECLAAGLPVLTLDTELMQEVVGSAGVQMPRERFHEGFQTIIAKEAQLRKLAKERAERYRAARVKDQYYALYQKAIADS